jgi:hypothetical protein
MTSLPTSVDGVIDRLRGIQADLPAADGVAVFNRMYLEVTERVAGAIDAGDFADPGFMAELDVRFANRWLAAVDAEVGGARPVSAWRPLFEERATAGLLPIQFALAGMNAHIEHDLPLAVVETCRARGTDPAAPAVRRDYLHVNEELAAVESGIRRSFLTEIGRWVDEEVGPLVHLVSAWNIETAREVAWVNVETLWTLRGLSWLFDRYAGMLSHTVGMGSRTLLTPVARALGIVV